MGKVTPVEMALLRSAAADLGFVVVPRAALQQVLREARHTTRCVFHTGTECVCGLSELNCALAAPSLPEQPQGEVVVTTNEQGHCVAVTRQNDEGQILSVIWEAPAGASESVAVAGRAPVAQSGEALPKGIMSIADCEIAYENASGDCSHMGAVALSVALKSALWHARPRAAAPIADEARDAERWLRLSLDKVDIWQGSDSLDAAADAAIAAERGEPR